MITSQRDSSPRNPPKRSTYKHVFVDSMPDTLEEGVLYISMRYATSAHRCFCGCGREVVTPLHPTKWQLIFDGVSVSLFPSVGSWSLPCQSHYWLKRGQVFWAESFSRDEIDEVRSRDLAAQDQFWDESKEPKSNNARGAAAEKSLWESLFSDRFKRR